MSLVQVDSLAWSCEVLLSQPVAIEPWAIWYLWGSSGLPIICGSILKVRVFQTSFSFQGLHSSSLPQLLHGAMRAEQCWVWVQWQGQGGTGSPCPSLAGLGCRAGIRGALVLLEFPCLLWGSFSPHWALPPFPCPPRGPIEVLVPSLLCWWLCLLARYIRK